MHQIIADLRALWVDVWYYSTRHIYRLFRGYDERDLWGLDSYIARRILPGLRAFKKVKRHSYPGGFKTFKEWDKAIDEMIFGLEQVEIDDPKTWKRAQAGRELLGKYMVNLWD